MCPGLRHLNIGQVPKVNPRCLTLMTSQLTSLLSLNLTGLQAVSLVTLYLFPILHRTLGWSYFIKQAFIMSPFLNDHSISYFHIYMSPVCRWAMLLWITYSSSVQAFRASHWPPVRGSLTAHLRASALTLHTSGNQTNLILNELLDFRTGHDVFDLTMIWFKILGSFLCSFILSHTCTHTHIHTRMHSCTHTRMHVCTQWQIAYVFWPTAKWVTRWDFPTVSNCVFQIPRCERLQGSHRCRCPVCSSGLQGAATGGPQLH